MLKVWELPCFKWETNNPGAAGLQEEHRAVWVILQRDYTEAKIFLLIIYIMKEGAAW